MSATAVVTSGSSSESKKRLSKNPRRRNTLKSAASPHKSSGKRFVLTTAGLNRIERFIALPDDNGCCVWNGPSVDAQGRPHLLLTDKSKQPTRVMRLLWEHYYGELPPTTWVFRTCRNKLCCSLYHHKAVEVGERRARRKKPSDAPSPSCLVVVTDESGEEFLAFSDAIPEGCVEVVPPPPKPVEECTKLEAAEAWEHVLEEGVLPIYNGEIEEVPGVTADSPQGARMVASCYEIIKSIAERAAEAPPSEDSFSVTVTKALLAVKMSARMAYVVKESAYLLLETLKYSNFNLDTVDTVRVIAFASAHLVAATDQEYGSYLNVPRGTPLSDDADACALLWAQGFYRDSVKPRCLPRVILPSMLAFFDEEDEEE